MLAYLHPEIEWKSYVVPAPGGHLYHGHEGFREMMIEAHNAFGDFRNEPERLIDAGDGKVVSFVRFAGRGRESGAEVEARLAHVFTLSEGKVLRVDTFEHRDEALRAAGVREDAG